MKPREWENQLIFEGWILSVDERLREPDGYAYRLRVGISDEEQIEVIAFRNGQSRHLLQGRAVRVTGRRYAVHGAGDQVLCKIEANRVDPISIDESEEIE